MPGIHSRMSRNVLIALMDWVSKPSNHASTPRHVRHDQTYQCTVRLSSGLPQEGPPLSLAFGSSTPIGVKYPLGGRSDEMRKVRNRLVNSWIYPAQRSICAAWQIRPA